MKLRSLYFYCPKPKRFFHLALLNCDLASANSCLMSSIFLVEDVLFNSASRVATVYSNSQISNSIFDMVVDDDDDLEDAVVVLLVLDVGGGAGA